MADKQGVDHRLTIDIILGIVIVVLVLWVFHLVW